MVKALGVAHKTDVGGVRLNLGSTEAVLAAVSEMSHLSDSFLIEEMVDDAVAELIVGVARDQQFGPYLVVGGGGILVEMMKDSVSLLLPTTRERVESAVVGLKCAPLLEGFRGKPPGDLSSAVSAILTLGTFVANQPETISELDINPLMVLAEGRGVIAADALISLRGSNNE